MLTFAALRAREFARLDADGHAYLDHTGAALYPERLVTSHVERLRGGIYGNPHAENPASLASSALIAGARARVLEFFDADPAEYAVVFTANATAACALVGSGFRFGPNGPLMLSADNHNSVNGTVSYVSVQNGVHQLLPGAAVPAGLDFLDEVDVSEIGRHANALALQLIEALTSMSHVEVYGPRGGCERGATVAFPEVESRARAALVSVRGGCFCNPGASEAAFGFPADVAGQCLLSASDGGWALAAFAACMRGYPVGAVRASFGMSSDGTDVERLVSVIESFAD